MEVPRRQLSRRRHAKRPESHLKTRCAAISVGILGSKSEPVRISFLLRELFRLFWERCARACEPGYKHLPCHKGSMRKADDLMPSILAASNYGDTNRIRSLMRAFGVSRACNADSPLPEYAASLCGVVHGSHTHEIPQSVPKQILWLAACALAYSNRPSSAS